MPSSYGTAQHCRERGSRAARALLVCTLVFLPCTLLGARAWGAGDATGGSRSIEANETIIFSVTGDIPYSNSEVTVFQEQVDEHNLFSPSELLFHVGDIKSGSESCSESRYRTVADILKSSDVPAYIVPGDNETTDCSSPSTGMTYWNRYFLDLELNWPCSSSTSRQSGRRENFAFVKKGILFVGINLVGGSNSSTIMQNDASWVSQQLQQQVANVRGAVIVAQAGPGGNRSTFFTPFVSAAKTFAKPILFIHGDGHSWIKDKPFSASNVTRVQVEAGGNEIPVQVTAPLSLTDFVFLRNPWDSHSSPVSRPPCTSGPPPTLTISDASVDEGNAGTVNAVFTVTLANPSGTSVSVNYATANGSAQSSQDYTSTSGSLSFSGSTTSRTVSVVIQGDTVDETDETFFVNLSSPSNATLGDGQGLGTIRDDDGRSTPPGSTVVLTPVADAHILVGSTSNFGSATELRVKADASIYHAYLKFQISGVGAVQAAHLRLFVTDATSVAGTVHSVSNNYEGTSTAWQESGLNGSNAPSITAPALASLGSTATGTWIEFDVSAAIAGNGTYSLALQSPATDSGYYSSKEGTNPPQLVLDLQSSTPSNSPPVASNDSYTVVEDNVLSVTAPGVLGDDNDPDGDPLTAVVVTSPAHGSLSLQGNGAFTYTPQANYNGSDAFTYEARDGRGGTDQANVALTVTSQPDAPVAAGESYTVQSGGSLDIPAPGVLGNDSDADGDALTAVLGANVAHGSLLLRSDGSFTYSPSAGFSGSDQFTYRARDASLQSVETTVALSVSGSGSGSGPVTFRDVQTGGSIALATVSTTGTVSGVAGDLFLACIGTKPSRSVTGVSGLGLSWSLVRAQCGGRGQTGIEIWMARGTPNPSSVTATFASSPQGATIAVARYAGSNASSPIGNVVSGNTNGVGAACSNGIDTPSYSFPASTQTGMTLFGAISCRDHAHTPGSGWTERAEFHHGASGSVAGVAVVDRQAAASSQTFDGTFDGTTDWSAIAVEIRGAGPAAKTATTEGAEVTTFTRLERIMPNPAGQFATLAFELSAGGPVEIAVFNVRGQRLRTLAQDVHPAGRYQVRWDLQDAAGQRVPAGVYFIQAHLGSRLLQQKLVVQR